MNRDSHYAECDCCTEKYWDADIANYLTETDLKDEVLTHCAWSPWCCAWAREQVEAEDRLLQPSRGGKVMMKGSSRMKDLTITLTADEWATITEALNDRQNRIDEDQADYQRRGLHPSVKRMRKRAKENYEFSRKLDGLIGRRGTACP
jgi:hypothetical protein